MNTRRTIVALALPFVAVWNLAGSAPQVALQANPQTVNAIADALRSPDWRVREKAVRTLGEARSPAGVAPLVAALGDENGSVRRSAREALVGCGDAAIAGATGALDLPAAGLRWQAAWVLGHIEDQRVIAPLVRALQDPDPMVRIESGVGLACIGVGSRIDAVVDGATRALANPRGRGREDAAWVLGHVSSPKGIAPLVAALDDVDAGWMAAASLGVLAGSGAGAPLADALASQSPRVRRAAAWALTKLRSPASVSALHRAQTDPDEEVRFWAAEALRSVGTVEAMRALSGAKSTRWDQEARRCAPPRSSATIASGILTFGGRSHPLYPELLDARPDIPSPLTTATGTELSVAATVTGKYAVVPVTLSAGDRQCQADGNDFPTLARTGLHAEIDLDRVRTITGRSVGEITELARPGRLSDTGFLGSGEDIVSVLRADNKTVAALGLTHPDLARPLLHIWNMMPLDPGAGRSNMSSHQRDNVTAVVSGGHLVTVAAGDAEGSRESVFADGLVGRYWIEIDRDLDESERDFLRQRYARLDPGQMNALVTSLTRIRTGENEPDYVMWYGFYGGHTPWRADPVAVALVFGLRTLEEIEAVFPGRLYELMTAKFAGDP